MLTKENFPRLIGATAEIDAGPALAFGDYPLDWGDDQSVDSLRNGIVGVQQTCRGDIDRLARISVAAFQDILASSGSFNRNVVACRSLFSLYHRVWCRQRRLQVDPGDFVLFAEF